MRQPDDEGALVDMLLYARRINRRLAGVTRQEFDDDEDLQLALTYMLQVIGEAASRVTRELRERHSTLPWAQIVGMRHRLVHQYFRVNLETVWDVATSDVPALVTEVEAILSAEFPPVEDE